LTGPPAGVRTTPGESAGATRVVLVRHGEARCNVEGVVGGPRGCRGLTTLGRRQVEELAERLAGSGELADVDALYSSVLPRAIETAEILATALGHRGPLVPVTDCGLCELHPGEADGLTWEEYGERFPEPDWDVDPSRPLAPGGESWTAFVERASSAVARLADSHPGRTVVVACHAGVIESTMVRFLPVDRSRLGLRTAHASLTAWERDGDRWLLERYNDVSRRSRRRTPSTSRSPHTDRTASCTAP
jgi:probable phosphoglycerate mutase